MDIARLRVTRPPARTTRASVTPAPTAEGFPGRAGHDQDRPPGRRGGHEDPVTLHYSDYWSNGLIQDIPKDWRAVTSLPEARAVAALEQHVRDYTHALMRKLEARDPPDYVSLGNETAAASSSLRDHRQRRPLGHFRPVRPRGLRGGQGGVPRPRVILHLDDAGTWTSTSGSSPPPPPTTPPTTSSARPTTPSGPARTSRRCAPSSTSCTAASARRSW
ncbi:hypothetical protein E5N77_01680 [Streptomyces sp. SS52]|nr:hypothetical protein E5N77_01680 [Streptomyces sp. SS52]